jgi:nucleoid-associated protein YgaU
VAAAAGTYKVRKGDSLTRIAQRVFGSSEQRHQQMLIDANPKIAKRVNKLYVGEVLTIPSIPGVAAASERASGQPSGTVAVKQAESDGKKESKPATVAAVAASTTKKKSASADNSGKGTKRTTVAAAQRPSRSGKKGRKASSGGETATERWYTIRGSDSLASIARDVLKDSRRWRELADVNGLRDPNKIIPGMRLKLPPAGPRQG